MPKIGNFIYPWGNGHYSRMMRLNNEVIAAVENAQMHYISKPPIYEKLQERFPEHPERIHQLCCKMVNSDQANVMINPINRILPTLDGWITGIRKEHSKNRNSMQMFQIDEQHGGILKINPIIDWSLEQIMEQIRERQIPYNALLDQNYSSIGCAPCTRAIKPGEDLRAGRWWWESQGHSECGLHMNYTKKEENN